MILSFRRTFLLVSQKMRVSHQRKVARSSERSHFTQNPTGYLLVVLKIGESFPKASWILWLIQFLLLIFRQVRLMEDPRYIDLPEIFHSRPNWRLYGISFGCSMLLRMCVWILHLSFIYTYPLLSLSSPTLKILLQRMSRNLLNLT